MSFIPCPNIAELTLQFTQGDGEFAENVFHVKRDEAWDSASLLAMAEAFMLWWYVGDGTNGYAGYQNTGVTMLQVAARDLTTESSPSVVRPNDTAHSHGVNADTELPNGVSFALTAHTGLAGRSFRGRTYLIGLTKDFVTTGDQNLAVAAAVTALVSAFNALITATHSADVHSQLVVCSKYSGVNPTTKRPIPRTAGIGTPIINYGYHDLFVDYQRRRAPGHNRHH